MAHYSRISPLYPDGQIGAVAAPRNILHARPRKLYFALKRISDVVVAALLLVLVMSWLVPLLALLIPLGSGGPVFFRQKRLGKNGRVFTCYKFRTMVPNKEADSKQADKQDPRITRLGRLLRSSNIDELPQVLNVLLGHMSLVGPRPHMEADCIRFAAIVPGYDDRHDIKPGITGLAQVKGYHGPTPDYESIFRRYQWDAFYIRNAGWWMDMRILALTVWRQITRA
ncbi:MAG: sugar transferase [Bacteroidetes bacterium]|nr:sugar transferase [Bacteroidota bacterium]